MRICKGTTECSQYDDIEIYVNGERLDKSWIYADEELGEVECIMQDQTCEILPVIVDGRALTYKIHSVVKIDAWKMSCGVCGG